jgi:hypothetical protein
MMKIFFGQLCSDGRFGCILHRCSLKGNPNLVLINRSMNLICLLPLIQHLPRLIRFYLFEHLSIGLNLQA